MRIILIFFITLIFSSFNDRELDKRKQINILFIGNSLTYYNSMPDILQKILDSEKKKYKVLYSAYFGISLKQHLTKKVFQQGEGTLLEPLKPGEISNTVEMLTSKKWDYAVLQDYSMPRFVPDNKALLITPSVQDILDIKKAAMSKVSEFVLFRVWPNNNSFPKKYNYSTVIHSLDEEVKLINAINDSISLAANLSNVPITNCYYEILKNHRNINLYDGPYHPSEYGAYLNACIFYKLFTKKDAKNIRYTAGLDSITVTTIQRVVDNNL